MPDNNLTQWLKRHAPAGVLPGELRGRLCWGLSYTTGKGYRRFPGTITKIGREYVTTDIFRDSRFRCQSPDTPYLIEADANGLVQMLFLSEQVLEAYIEREELCSELRRNVQKWSATASIPKLKAAIAILDGSATDYMASQLLACANARKEEHT